MALTNPQGKIILLNDNSRRITFPVTGNTLTTTGTDLDAPNVVTDQLGAWYEFEGNLNDSSGNGHHATVVGGTASYVTGANGIGQGLQIDGSSYFNIGSSSDVNPTSAVTVDLWLRRTNSGGGSTVLTGGVQVLIQGFGAQGYAIRLDAKNPGQVYSTPDQYIFARAWNGSPTEASYLVIEDLTSQYAHIVLTYDSAGGSNNVRLYINKVCRFIGTQTGSISYAGSTFFGANNGGAENTNAKIDSLKIYTKALSDGGVTATGQTATGEIAQNYAADGGV